MSSGQLTFSGGFCVSARDKRTFEGLDSLGTLGLGSM